MHSSLAEAPPRAALFTGVLIFFLFGCGAGAGPGTSTGAPVVELRRIEFDAKDQDRKNSGGVILMGIFQLRSNDRRFGGLSGLSLTPDGRLHAISDRGHWMSAAMVSDEEGRLVDLTEWEIGALLTPEGAPVRGRFADAEALTRDLDGALLVAFEQAHRLWRYPAPGGFRFPPLPVPLPPEISKAPANGGLEALTVLPDGRLLAIAEEFKNADGSSKGWLIENGRFAEIAYVPSEGYNATDCVALNNGDVLVLERRFFPLGMLRARVARLPARSLVPGARLVGEELFRVDPPLAAENFEGIAAWEDPLKGTMIYLVSDDNYLPFQRTLLLQFRWLRPQKMP
jgi:hypothetical protein